MLKALHKRQKEKLKIVVLSILSVIAHTILHGLNRQRVVIYSKKIVNMIPA